ncbi:unnamed protein product [Paramecium primaurelia]|uniref:Uncharacterized protein n=1 Tax=Paramecium primaurelia TaxID=5886 RepID=A0A8S1JRQ6_PARPR|nr:unnamed protein product [Paramecium primaurelia]
MITISNQELTPCRLYLLKTDKLNIKNKQEEGLTFTFIQQKSKPLKLEEQYKFDCKVGNHYLICEKLNLKAEVYVFKTQQERDKYQAQEEEFKATKSEQQYDSEDISNENDEIMSEEIGKLPQKKKKSLKWSTVETSSTYYSKKENQSTTSDMSEQLLPEKRGKRKGSDPVIQKTEFIVKPKIQRGTNQINNLLQIQQYAKITSKKQITISQDQLQLLKHNWDVQKLIYEYLINQYSYQ